MREAVLIQTDNLLRCPVCGEGVSLLIAGQCRPCRSTHNAPRPSPAPLRDPMDAYPMDWRIQQAKAKARQYYGL